MGYRSQRCKKGEQQWLERGSSVLPDVYLTLVSWVYEYVDEQCSLDDLAMTCS